MTVFTVQDLVIAINKQKRSKAPGPDGIHMEAFLYGSHRLCVCMSILLNMCLIYGYVPDDFHLASITPLVKCKTGDLSDVNNYRAIAVSNSVTKILEELLYHFIMSDDKAEEHQFGFKSSHSTAICTHVFKRTVDYCRLKGSHVFCCFIDFNKAFDNVNYWLLFCKLLQYNKSSMCCLATRLLAYWYSHQRMFVCWQNGRSDCFSIDNGVRQGGVLSPFLFRIYIREMIKVVINSRIGCHAVGICTNLLAYADDLVLLAPSWQGLQNLLVIIEKAASDIGLSFNAKKTVCMVFNPCDRSKLVCESFPSFTVSGCDLKFVPQFKYLGHIIDRNFSDDADINREIKCLFARTNILIRRFYNCSRDVKLRLFRCYCLCFYDIALWKVFAASAVHKFSSSYVKCMKLFFGFHKYSSVTGMLLELGLPSFSTVMHNASVHFNSAVANSPNTLVNVFCSLRCC